MTPTTHQWITNTNIHPNDQVFDTEGRMVADCKWTNFVPTEREQHALLIAAAPALLTALKETLELFDRDPQHQPDPIQSGEAIDRALAAIRQAGVKI